MRKVSKQSIASILLVAMIFSVFGVFTVYGAEELEETAYLEEEVQLLNTDSLLEQEPVFDMGEQGIGINLTGSVTTAYGRSNTYTATLSPTTAEGNVTVKIYPEDTGSFETGTEITGTMTAGKGSFPYTFNTMPGKYVIEARYVGSGADAGSSASHKVNVKVNPVVKITGPYEARGNTPVVFDISVLPAEMTGTLDFLIDERLEEQSTLPDSEFTYTFSSLDLHEVVVRFNGTGEYEGIAGEGLMYHMTIGTDEPLGTSRLNPYLIDSREKWELFTRAINTGSIVTETIYGNDVTYDGTDGGKDKYWRITNVIFFDGDTIQMVGDKPERAFKGNVDVAEGGFGSVNMPYAFEIASSTAYDGSVVAGLFGYTDGAELNNVAIEDFKVKTTATGSDNAYAGGLVGMAMNDTKIYNCYVGAGEVTANAVNGSSYSGSVAANMQGTGVGNEIENLQISAKSTGNSNSARAYAGGLYGNLDTGASTSGNLVQGATVVANSEVEVYAGGVAGKAAGTISEEEVREGTVKATGSTNGIFAGGIVGSTTMPVMDNKASYVKVEGIAPSSTIPNLGALIGKTTGVATGNIAHYAPAQAADVPLPSGTATESAPGFRIGLQVQAATNNATGTRVKLMGGIVGQYLSSDGVSSQRDFTFFRRGVDADDVVVAAVKGGGLTVDNVDTAPGFQTFLATITDPVNEEDTTINKTSGPYNLVLIEATRMVRATTSTELSLQKEVISTTETLRVNVKVDPETAAPYGRVTIRIYKGASSALWLTTSPVYPDASGEVTFARANMPVDDYKIEAEFASSSGDVASSSSQRLSFKVVEGNYFTLAAPSSVLQDTPFEIATSMLASMLPDTTNPYYVKFYDTSSGSNVLLQGQDVNGQLIDATTGRASLTVPGLAVGSYKLKAIFTPPAPAVPIETNIVDLTVNPKQVKVTIDGPIKTAEDTPVTYTGNVTIDGSTPVAGKVELFVNGVATGIISNLSTTQTPGYTLVHPGFATGGTYEISVKYMAGGDYPEKFSPTMKLAVGSVITVTTVEGPWGFTFGTSGQYMAKVTAENGMVPTGSVIFTVRDSSDNILGTPYTFPLINGTATWTASGMPLGRYSVVATYTPSDEAFYPSESLPMVFSVNNPQVELALGAPVYSRWGETITMTALYPDLEQYLPKRANGIVEFWAFDYINGHHKLGETVMVDGYAEWTTDRWQLIVGDHQLYAYFLGDGDDEYVWQKSNQVLHEVDTGDTWVRVTSDGYSLIDENITVTCWVDALWEDAPGGRLVGGEYDGKGKVSGFVQFYVNGKEFGSHIPLVDGIASLTMNWVNLPWDVGSYEIKARFIGNDNYTLKDSPTEIYQIGRGRTWLILTATPELDSRYADSVTFRATVYSSDKEQKTGYIEFYIDGVLYSTREVVAESNQEVMTGFSTITLSTLSVGNHTIHAKYLGDRRFEPSEDTKTHTVQKQYPTLTYKANHASTYGLSVPLVVYVTGDVGARVQFFDGATLLGETTVVSVVENGVTYKKASIMTTPLQLSKGLHDIKVVYLESANYLQGQVIGQQIIRENTAGFVLESTAPNGAEKNEPITFTATLYGYGVSGDITLFIDDVPVKTESLVANPNAYGVLTYDTSSLSAGVHKVEAVYYGDINYGRQSTNIIYQGVAIDHTSVTIKKLTGGTLQYGDESRISATVGYASGGRPTGMVEFFEIVGEGADERIVRLGSSELSVYTSTANFVFDYFGATYNLEPGVHKIYAVYSGDELHASSESEVFGLEIAKKEPVITLSSIKFNNAKINEPVTIDAIVRPAWVKGTIELYKDGEKISEGVINERNRVTFDLPGYPEGSYKIEAKYLGNDLCAEVMSDAVDLRVNQAGGVKPGTGSGGSSGSNNPKPQEPKDEDDNKEEPNLEKSELKLYINDGKATVDGDNAALDAVPYIDIDSGRTMVPIRFISEACGYEVHWYPDKNRTVRIVDTNGSGKEIELYIGNTVAAVDGKPVKLDTAPIIKDDRTFVPIRMIIETMNKVVEWDNDTRTVTIIVDQPKEYNTVVILDEYSLNRIQEYSAEEQAATYRFLEVHGQLYSNVRLRTLPKGVKVFYSKPGIPRNVILTVQGASFKDELNISKYVKVLKYNPITGAHEILVGEVTYNEKFDEFIITFQGDADSMYAIITTEGN